MSSQTTPSTDPTYTTQPPSDPPSTSTSTERLALPAPPAESEIDASNVAQQQDGEERVRTLNVQTEEGVQLDDLGPVIVNNDGTISRISNWSTLTPLERERVIRLIGKKRNKERMEKIRAEGGEGDGAGEGGAGQDAGS